MQNIVFLDRGTVTVPFRMPKIVHEWVDYPRTETAEVVERLGGTAIAVTNKVQLREPELAKLPQLQFIAITAT